jgi:hypothetical protein
VCLLQLKTSLRRLWKSVVHIPEIIEKMQFLIDMLPEKENAHFDKYSYYITGIKMEGRDLKGASKKC